MTHARNIFLALVLSLTGALAAPSAEARHRGYDAYCRSCGTVARVERTYTQDRHLGGGTVLGALIGGALGNQVGKGDGRKAATVAGALAGGAVGHRVEKNRRHEVRGFRVTVRMDHGGYRTIETPYDYDLRRGDRVSVSGNRVRPLY